jgi:hypothetical protein
MLHLKRATILLADAGKARHGSTKYLGLLSKMRYLAGSRQIRVTRCTGGKLDFIITRSSLTCLIIVDYL